MRAQKLFVAAVTLVVGLALASSANADPLYQVTDLGSLGGVGSYSVGSALNASGQVVGYSYNPAAGVTHAFLYSGGAMQDLGTLGGSSSYATGISSGGQIVGYSYLPNNNNYHAFSDINNVMTDISAPFSYSRALAISNSDIIAGDTNISGSGASLFYANNWHDLGVARSSATAINNNNELAGYYYNGSNTHAFIYSAGVVTDLGALISQGVSIGLAMNSNKQVVGYANASSGDFHAFLYNYNNGAMSDLGTLGGSYSYAYGINSSGLIVGTSTATANGNGRAFLTANGSMTDLNDLVIPTSLGFQLTEATAINDNGMIVANGVTPDGQSHALLLSPYVPALPTSQVNWTASQGGSWSVVGNWNPSTVPNGNTYSVGIDFHNSNQHQTVTLDGNQTVHDLTLTGAAGITIDPGTGGGLTLAAGNTGSSWTMVRANSGSHTLNANLTLNSPSDFLVLSGARLNVAGVISNGASANSLMFYGGGTLSLSGQNTFSGGLSASDGTIQVPTINNAGSSGPLGSNSLISLGLYKATSTLEYTGTSTSSNMPFAFVPNGAAVLQIDQPNTTLTLSGLLSGSGSFTKSGPGTLLLSGNNTHTGGTTVSNGVLVVGSNNALGNGQAIVNSGATLLVSAGMNVTQPIYLYSGTGYDPGTGPLGALTTNGGNVNIAQLNVGSATINTGGAKLAITSLDAGGDEEYESATFIGGGVVSVDSIGYGDITFDHMPVTLNSSSGYITIQNAGLLKVVPQFNLSSANLTTSSQLDTRGNSGTLNYLALSSSSVIDSTNSGASVQLGYSDVRSDGNSTISGVTIDHSSNPYSDTYVTSGQLVLTSGAKLLDGFGYVYSPTGGTTTVSVGGGAGSSNWTNGQSLYVGYGGGTGTLNVTSGGSVTSATDVYVGWISTGTLTVTNGGSVTDANGYVGYQQGATGNAYIGGGTGNSSWINQGSLAIGVSGFGRIDINANGLVGAGSLEGTGSVNFYGGTLWVTGNDTASNLIYLNTEGGTIDTHNANNSPNTLTLTGVLYGPGGLTKTGASRLVLTGANTYSGNTTVNAGTFLLDNSGSFAYSPTISVNSGGTLDVSHVTGGANFSNSMFKLLSTQTLNVTGGGTVSAAGMGIEGTANFGGGTNTASLTATTSLVVGYAGTTGTLNVSDGGNVTTTDSGGAVIGNNSGSVGTVNIGGGTRPSSWFNSGSGLDIGLGGMGTLSITGGGTVTQHGTVTLGSQTGSTGNVTVDGNGQTNNATLSATADINISYDGTGNLTIKNGGGVFDANAYIGYHTGTAKATVGGGTGNSTWTNSQNLYVGYQSNGTLNIMGGGSVTVGGAYSQNSSSKLAIELSDALAQPGNVPLSVTGSASLAGTLEIDPAAGFVPTVGEMFDVLTADGGVSGTFSTVNTNWIGSGHLVSFSTIYYANKVTIAVNSVVSVVPGDYNGNGIVDAADYIVWRKYVGQNYPLLNRDSNAFGLIGQSDYQFWRARLGNNGNGNGNGASVLSTAIPEPASSVLLIAASSAIISVCSRRRALLNR